MGKLRLVYDQLEIFQVLQSSPTPQTSNWSGTIFCRFLQQTGSSRNPPKYFYQCLQCSSADGDRLVRWDARDAAFFFRKQVARGSRVWELLSKRKLWHHRSRRGFSDQNPIGCSPSKSSTTTKRAHNQSIFYSPHPLTYSITPLAAALLLPLSQQLSRVLLLLLQCS